jgi:hypothetical protein
VSKFLDDLEHGAEVDTNRGTDTVAKVDTNQEVDNKENNPPPSLEEESKAEALCV